MIEPKKSLLKYERPRYLLLPYRSRTNFQTYLLTSQINNSRDAIDEFSMMASTSDPTLEFRPDLPISISQIGGRYVIFDVKLASWLRREHRICGVTIGTLPIAPSQNLFLGVPVEIMPEEAQLLAERGIAVVVDDARAHDLAVRAGDKARRDDYMARIERQAIVV